MRQKLYKGKIRDGLESPCSISTGNKEYCRNSLNRLAKSKHEVRRFGTRIEKLSTFF